MFISIDRFEGNFAVCELPDGNMTDIDRSLLPGAQEGDVFRQKEDGNFEKDEAETEHRRKMAWDLQQDLWK